ncbi:uncharacterized protein LOC143227215 [Tachypleus tridentatus]|uniref:uncharacterized protein LOC143227215 n=1 Tax=Tachypleus tridentatus TaxID=6853 RepID=UPI003FD67F8D
MNRLLLIVCCGMLLPFASSRWSPFEGVLKPVAVGTGLGLFPIGMGAVKLAIALKALSLLSFRRRPIKPKFQKFAKHPVFNPYYNPYVFPFQDYDGYNDWYPNYSYGDYTSFLEFEKLRKKRETGIHTEEQESRPRNKRYHRTVIMK